uniref:RNA-directed RNA polymerase n=1 Tax=Leviviridae sp. TaxID=2027243 RepID=A0A514D4X6_9VIRU|nr:MAG: RNA-dependent RNA polymerase [Leviviridae sp.]
MANFLPTSVEKAILRLFDDLGTPVSLKVKILWEAEEWDQLALLELEPKHYVDSDRFWRDAMAVSIVRKLETLPTSFDRKAVAEESFLECERKCFRTNLRLLPYLSPGLPDTEAGVLSYLAKVRKIVKTILGPCPDTHETYEHHSGAHGYKVRGRFGPGATFSDRGQFSTVPDKMSSEPTLTPSSVYYALPWADTLWARACKVAGRSLSFVRGNRFTTVPKDCKRHRGIAIEPSINLFYQLGYGRVIRQRLRKSGIDLTSASDLHKRVACDASIRGDLSTLDLSNASDTVCTNLVKLVLPSDWFAVLTDLRSSHTLFREKWVLLEKFSSMGNGFTFELETLVFLGLMLALPSQGEELIPGHNVHVFGDDIIIPKACSEAAVAVLSFLGLEINRKKSFVDGPFRESCGGDYFLGADVRPHFLKDSPNEPQQLIALANGLRRASKEVPSRLLATRRSWFGVLDGLPSHIRSLCGPSDLGDLCVHDEERFWNTRSRSGIRYIKVYRPARFRKVSWRHFRPDVVLACAAYGTGGGELGVTPRDAVLGYKVGWVARS